MEHGLIRILAAALVVALICAYPSASSAQSSDTRLTAPDPTGRPAEGHPRIFFDRAGLEAWRKHIDTSRHGQVVRDVFAQRRRDLPRVRQFADLDLSAPTPADLEAHFRPDETRNILWGLLALDAVLRDDLDQKRIIARAITNYAKLILASRELGGGVIANGRTGENLNRQQRVWENDEFNVGVSWLFGAAGLPIAYDVLHDAMTPEERLVVERALVAATTGRRPFGSDQPRGRAISNHYGYHGELAVMLAAIEESPGFDRPTWDRIRQVLRDYVQVGFTPEGDCHEDTYGPNLGLRAGSMGLLVMARRGEDLLRTEHYRNIIRWMAHDSAPFVGGGMVGGASGTHFEYPTSVIVARHVLPNEPAADWLYRLHLGEDSRRMNRNQTMLEFVLFGGDPSGIELNLPLTHFSPRRGKLITRTDFSPDATVLHFDARPDAWSIGHDTVDRGTFSLLADGRYWTRLISFHHTQRSRDFSLVHVDGLAQGWKAPSVRFMSHRDTSLATGGTADLKYAYDWQWTPPTPWPRENDVFPAPWEHENSDPRSLGWPDDPDWLPHTLRHPGIGYVGSWLWRKPYNPVQHAFRSAVLVRGDSPYVLIIDDVQKDDAVRQYEWLLQIPLDVEIQEQSGNDILLRDSTGRRLLVRVLNADGLTDADIEQEQITTDRAGVPVHSRRLVLRAQTHRPQFRVMLCPLSSDESLPITNIERVDPGTQRCLIKTRSGDDRIVFTDHPDGRTRILLQRGNESFELN